MYRAAWASITSELEKKSSADPSCGTCVEWTGGAGRWGAALAGASGLLAPMTVTVRAQLLGLSLAVLAAVVTWGNLSQHRRVKTIKALTETSRRLSITVWCPQIPFLCRWMSQRSSGCRSTFCGAPFAESCLYDSEKNNNTHIQIHKLEPRIKAAESTLAHYTNAASGI